MARGDEEKEEGEGERKEGGGSCRDIDEVNARIHPLKYARRCPLRPRSVGWRRGGRRIRKLYVARWRLGMAVRSPRLAYPGRDVRGRPGPRPDRARRELGVDS